MDDQIVRLGSAEQVPPCTVVIFGASGDLAMRKLIPALYSLDACGERMLADETMILGCARRSIPIDQFRQHARDAIKRYSNAKVEDACWDRFAARLDYLAGIEDLESFGRLKARLEQIEASGGLPPNRVFYLAIPPGSILDWVQRLHDGGLISPPQGRGFSRVVVEKPIGVDLESARAINNGLRKYLDESQIFRIDHYLGKETVRNFLVLRFGNSIFEQIWNSHHVDHVQITVSEAEGVGSRAAYYDHAGALRDMVQNHIFQLLTLIAMEPPVTLEAEAIRESKLNVLRAIKPLSPEEVHRQVVRAQYSAGQVDGKALPDYLHEQGITPNSPTETYVALKLFVNNWRWSGVPFYLRTGKALPRRASSIAIHFKHLPSILFAEHHRLPANVLTLRIQPDEGFSLSVVAKQPGLDLSIRPVNMDLEYEREFQARSPEAYEMLLYEVMIGDQTLFVEAEMVDRSWQFIQSILDVWNRDGRSGLVSYPAGSWGPEAAHQLLISDSCSWREP
ncbi:MAG TPA: glucose-6-phosphate dehydrogenase [Candidatus Binataceae bacterium]|jgi:glucose-6-phosphate 1-dehydrogenase|nr:glucose-6-phosphate dehydrogenase [Candidatus Binataceae bacterium]